MQLRFVNWDEFAQSTPDNPQGVTMVQCPSDWDTLSDIDQAEWIRGQVAELNPEGHRQAWEIVPDGYPAYPE